MHTIKVALQISMTRGQAPGKGSGGEFSIIVVDSLLRSESINRGGLKLSVSESHLTHTIVTLNKMSQCGCNIPVAYA
jgi:hypothetical protein